MFRYAIGLLFALALALGATPPLLAQTTAPSHAPAAATDGFEIYPGLEVMLFASEPMLINPTNIDIDSRGRVWVCEAFNYRTHLNPDNPIREAGDRILILEDTDGDGHADEQTVFYQGPDINAALGIAVLGNRVIVSVSPHVFVFTDEDGDDVPDRKEILFTGIGGVQHDHGVHAFVFGPDGKLYFNYGNEGKGLYDAGGTLLTDVSGQPARAEGQPFWQGMVFRLDPDGSNLEVVAHNFRNNYEVALDSYGTMWQSDNDDDGNRGTRINYVMAYGNFGRRDEMTGANWRARRTNQEADYARRQWHQNDPGVVPNLLHTGAGSPTGMVVYEGRLLPEVFWDQMIHADAGPNVVRAYPVSDRGAGYEASIVNLVQATTDPWFRPSDVAVAPDGSVFIADWYDPGVGGHQMGDLARGRIFRVAPPGTPYTIPDVRLDTPDAAAAALRSPNLATRYEAWMALEAMGTEAEPALRVLWNDPTPRIQARALWLLARLDDKADAYVQAAILDADANLRITGLRAARQAEVDVLPYLRTLSMDPSAQVRREVALTLRHHPAPEAAALWAKLALQHDGDDRWYLEALGIGADRQWDAFFQAWLDRVGDGWNTPEGHDIIWRARTDKALPYLAQLATDADRPLAERLRYFRAFDFHGDAKRDVLLAMLDERQPDRDDITPLALHHLGALDLEPTPAITAALDRTLAQVAGTQRFVDLVDRYDRRDQNPALRDLALAKPDSSIGVDAARLLLRFDGAPLLADALNASESATVSAALTVLGRLGSQEARDLIEPIALDPARPLSVRRAGVEALGQGWSGEDRLIALLEAGTLDADLVPVAAGRLLTTYRSSVRETGARYLTIDAETRDAPLPPLRDLAEQDGDAGRGQLVFERTCSACHQVDGTGIDFGPDLSGIGSKLSKEALYLSILKPSAGISFGYEGYLLTLTDGSQVVGYLLGTTADAVDLRMAGGLTRTIPRNEITAMEELPDSLMPAGLEQTMTKDELVDLIQYLNSLGGQ